MVPSLLAPPGARFKKEQLKDISYVPIFFNHSGHYINPSLAKDPQECFNSWHLMLG